MIKRIISMILIVTLMFNVAGVNVYADNNDEKKYNLDEQSLQMLEKTFNTVQSGTYHHELVDEVKDKNGKVLKEITTDIERTVKKNDSEGIIKVVLEQDKTIEQADGTIEKENIVDEVEITKNGEFYVNGEEIPVEDLNQTFEMPKNTTNASGGYNWLTYYSINYSGTDTYYYKAYERPSNNFLDPPGEGPYFNFTTYNSNSSFENLARDVGAARDNIVEGSAALLSALGLSTLTWNAVVIALTAVGATAVYAVQVWNNSSSGKSYMRQAYNIYR